MGVSDADTKQHRFIGGSPATGGISPSHPSPVSFSKPQSAQIRRETHSVPEGAMSLSGSRDTACAIPAQRSRPDGRRAGVGGCPCLAAHWLGPCASSPAHCDAQSACHLPIVGTPLNCGHHTWKERYIGPE